MNTLIYFIMCVVLGLLVAEVADNLFYGVILVLLPHAMVFWYHLKVSDSHLRREEIEENE